MTTTTTPIEPTSKPAATNVNVSTNTSPSANTSLWTASRVIALFFSVLEVLLLVRFALKLFGANAEQALVSAIYGVTEPLVAPFRGIFAQPAGTPVVEIATLLSIVFFVLVAALAVAAVRAATGRRNESNPST
ncbi:MAG TPA: YggT family protein [Candidatus Limnocylindria bacterium]|nr:YggT family protein [Candidatus Limnocylindria bacterium]